ncbi:MAG: hypothetical protein FJZ62_05930 [Chlamydiae bacterium]|nr:hypothetical protein [Chlamydiota bacterium]
MQKPRCGAKTKTRNGEPCRNGRIRGGRCRMHGGKSTGPKTPEGLARLKLSRTKHGMYSKENLDEKRFLLGVIRETSKLLS